MAIILKAYKKDTPIKERNLSTDHYLIIVGRKSPYFSEGLDSPSLRQ